MRTRANTHPRLAVAVATAAALVLALAACGGVDGGAPGGEATPPATTDPTPTTDLPLTDTDPDEQPAEADSRLAALADALALWEEAGPESYRLFVSVGCAAPCANGPFLVTVEQGAVADVVYSASGPGGEPPASAFELSAEGLFAIVEDALGAGAAVVDVEYDEATGLPVRAFLEGVPEDAVSYFEARLLEDVEDAELAAARDRWTALGLDRYVIELRRNCFCPPEYVGPFRVTVVDGSAETVEFAPGGPQGEPPADAGVLTVEGLFAALEEAKARGAAEVRVTYDPETGIPTEVYIDQILEAVDEEIGYEVRLLEP